MASMATCLQGRVLDSNAIMQCPGFGLVPSCTENRENWWHQFGKTGHPDFWVLKSLGQWPMANDQGMQGDI